VEFTTFCIVKKFHQLMATFMAKHLAKKLEIKNNLKHCKFLKEFTTLKVTTFE
jgi:hypothetical protein